MKILQYPHDTLRQVCDPVDLADRDVQRAVRALVKQMLQHIHDHRAYGLSAPQVNVPIRVYVVHVPNEKSQPLVFVNPRIEGTSLDMVPMSEGCLSFGTLRDSIYRPSTVAVSRWTEFGVHDRSVFTGWTARAILHEQDHIDGKVFLDLMQPAARKKYDKLIRKRNADVTT